MNTATTDTEKEPPCTTGAACLGAVWIVILTVLIYAMALVCLYSLWAIWPSGSASATPRSVPVALFRQDFTITSDEQLFAVVGLAGALGGIVHGLRSIGWYAGNRELKWSWVAFYLLLPPVGAAGGTIFYIVARGGLLPSSQSNAQQVNAYGFAAMAALVGLFSDQAFIKLKAVAETLFDKAEEGENHAAPKNKPAAAITTPPSATGQTTTTTTTTATDPPPAGENTGE